VGVPIWNASLSRLGIGRCRFSLPQPPHRRYTASDAGVSRGGNHGGRQRNPIHRHGDDLRGVREGCDTSLGKACRGEGSERRPDQERGPRDPGGRRHQRRPDDRRHPGGREVPGETGGLTLSAVSPSAVRCQPGRRTHRLPNETTGADSAPVVFFPTELGGRPLSIRSISSSSRPAALMIGPRAPSLRSTFRPPGVAVSPCPRVASLLPLSTPAPLPPVTSCGAPAPLRLSVTGSRDC